MKELFLEVLLPKRKLNNFATSLKLSPNPNDDQLCEFFFEHRLKELYQVYLQVLEAGLKDELDFFKENVTVILGDLLKAKPEQEEVNSKLEVI